MRKYRVYQVDAFTDIKFKGNPAGVVPNADGLSDEEMLTIARELNNSETAFLFSPDGSDHEVRIRYFTPKIEVPVCGHATIAAHYVRALENNLDSCTVYHKIKIGVLPVEITKTNSEYTVTMTQGSIHFAPPLGNEVRSAMVAALGLREKDLNAACPVQIVSTGHSKVMIGINSREKLNSLNPDMVSLAKLSAVIGCNGYFIFTLDAESPEVLTHGRMFAPAIGINEDPVTGNANGPLGAYLVRHRLVRCQQDRLVFNGEQGSAIGRSGIVHVEVQIENGEPVQVKVGGQAVIAFKTEIELS